MPRLNETLTRKYEKFFAWCTKLAGFHWFLVLVLFIVWMLNRGSTVKHQSRNIHPSNVSNLAGTLWTIESLSHQHHVQRWTKRWTCFAKQEPGRVSQKFLAIPGPPYGPSLYFSHSLFRFQWVAVFGWLASMLYHLGVTLKALCI